MVDAMVSEKRTEYRHYLGMTIDVHVDASAYGAFVLHDVVSLKRAISNLVNNAVEALEGVGVVVVSVSATSHHVTIRVGDNGPGMPPETVASLGRRGFSQGKATGSGLGLYQVMTAIQGAGGDVHVDSRLGEGTQISLVLKRQLTPSWFLDTLDLRDYEQVVVVDDDQSIHGIWQDRLQAVASSQAAKLSLVHLQNAWQLRDHRRGAKPRAFYLIDLDLHGSAQDGLTLIEELRLQNESALVTSHYGERSVIERCRAIGVSIIPKPAASTVPVVMN